MTKQITFIFLMFCLVFAGTTVNAQDAEAPQDGWEKGAGLGLDLSQLLQFNPKVGAGENRIGVGGALSFFAKYKEGLMGWDNIASLNYGLQKLGSGLFVYNPEIDVPWQKSLDELRLNSKFSYKVNETSKWAYAVDFGFLSQLTKTYAGNYVSNIDQGVPDSLQISPYRDGYELAKFLNPGTITFGIGMDYKPSDKLSLYISPVTLKTILVTDDQIANNEAEDTGNSVHGNGFRSATDFDNNFLGVGAMLKATYTDKLWSDKIAWKSQLALFSDYLNNPQNIDVDWNNEFGVEIAKGLQLTLLLNAFYDHDVFVQITDNSVPGGVSGLGRRVSITEQILLKYNLVF